MYSHNISRARALPRPSLHSAQQMRGYISLRIILLALLGTLALAFPQFAYAEKISAHTLDNGLEIVVIEDHRAPIVTQMVWYRTGAADEPPGQSGIAHFFEHLMFKGTDKLPNGGFSAAVQAQGGEENAFTSHDYTAYFQRVAADRLPIIMAMEADRMRNLRLTPEDIETEREVILEERALRVDTAPGALLNEQISAAQYLSHPYGTPVIGWRHEITQLTREDALSFYRTHYAPNNAILIVAGDVEPQAVYKMAQKHFGTLSPSADIPPRIRPAEPPQIAARRIIYEDPRVSDPYILRSYLAPSRTSGDQTKAAALTILAELLGGSAQTSLMARNLQFGENPYALYTAAFYSPTALDETTFGLVASPRPGVSLSDLEAALDHTLSTFMQNGPGEAEFARIKTQIRAADIYGRDSINSRARLYGAALTTGLTLSDVANWPDALANVTLEDVMAAAREVLVPQRSVTGWLLLEGQDAPPAP